MDMEIKEIIRITGLLKKVNCQNFALVSEIAKEMGEKKTAVMQYIENNPKLFNLMEVKDSKGKTKGLAVLNCYLTAVDNPATDEWLERQKGLHKKTLEVSELNYYGIREFLYIDITPKDSWKRAELWLNTPEKIQGLVDSGILKKTKRIYGGISDCFDWEGYELTKEVREALENDGWTLVYPGELGR